DTLIIEKDFRLWLGPPQRRPRMRILRDRFGGRDFSDFKGRVPRRIRIDIARWEASSNNQQQGAKPAQFRNRRGSSHKSGERGSRVYLVSRWHFDRLQPRWK